MSGTLHSVLALSILVFAGAAPLTLRRTPPCQATWHWESAGGGEYPTEVIWCGCTLACTPYSCHIDMGSSGGNGWANCVCDDAGSTP